MIPLASIERFTAGFGTTTGESNCVGANTGIGDEDVSEEEEEVEEDKVDEAGATLATSIPLAFFFGVMMGMSML